MSLGDVTKCDLSAGIAKVHYEVLVASLKYSLTTLVREIRSKLEEYDPYMNERATSFCVTNSHGLSYKYKEMQRIAELLHTLQHANPFCETEEKREIEWV